MRGFIASTILGIAVALQIGAQSTTPDVADYTNRACQAVEKALRESGQPAGQLRVEIVEGPVFPADHANLHRSADAPPPGRARLSGRLFGDAWEPVAGARVRLILSPAGDPSDSVSAVTSTTGEFQFPDVPPGEYRILSEPGSTAPLTLEAGRHRVLLGNNEPIGFILETARARAAPFLPTVVLASYNGDEFLRLNGVGFEGSQARISWTVDAATAAKDLGRLPSGGDIGEFGAVASLPSEAERKQLPGDLIPLLTSLFDVARSADRLKPILSSRVICRLYYSGERQLPTIEDPRCAALVLDSNALAMWFYMEGTGDISWPLFDWSSSRERAPDEQRIAAPLRALEALRSELRGAGMFEPEHSARLQQSLRAMTAALPIARVTIVESASVFPLPKGDLYLINAPYPIFLIREGRELRIAGVFLAGG